VRLALLADLHIGFGYRRNSRDPRREDSFRNAEEAIRLAAQRADAILIAGDIFHRPDISTDVFLRALDVFDTAKEHESKVLVNGEAWRGTPIIAIRGNHDVRSDLHRHPVLLLHRAHRLIYVNAQQVTLEKDGERVVVTGAGWVPDKNVDLVRRYFTERVPKPKPGAYNVLMLHQPLEGIGRYPGENPLPISLLPPGFDVYHSGHLHWHLQRRVSDKWIVIPGSTVRTQLSDREVEDDRAFWILDTKHSTLEEVILPSARKGYVFRINVQGLSASEVVRRVAAAVEEAIARNDRPLPPIVKIVLEGSTYDVFDFSSIYAKYEDKAIVKIFDRTTSAAVEKLAEIASADIQDDETFSPAFARQMLVTAMLAVGLRPGKDFDRFYALLSGIPRLSRVEERDVILDRLEKLLFSAVELLRDEETPASPSSPAPPRRNGGSILDWAEG